MTTERTRCGTPRSDQVGRSLVVYGWVDRRRDHGGLIFLDVRDTSGVLQVVIHPETAAEAHSAMHRVRLEWVVRVEGELRARAPEAVNPKLSTGEVELMARRCTVLAEARTPPFAVNEDTEVDETLRLQYRYLELRRPRLQDNLRRRAAFIAGLRESLVGQGFIEIETPMLIRATPEGARDYLVPSRIFPGSFYALPQSPQLYKQLSMVAGLDRYFQIARCMRDEDLRADRQPEFTQLDLEMSFVDEEDVFAATEQAICHAWARAGFRGSLIAPFPRITFAESMRRFGVDKPDMRFGLELCDLTEAVRGSQFRVFAGVVAGGGVVRGLRVPGGADLARSFIEGELTKLVIGSRAQGLAHLWRRTEGWDGPIRKFFSEDELAAIGAATGAEPGDCVLMVADRAPIVNAALGALRNHLGAARRLYDPDHVEIVWVTEFPMFEQDQDTGAISPAHHPFTQIHPDDVDRLEADPLSVRSRAYDLVINGREVASGSIRITDPALQRRVFQALGIGPEEAQRKFGFLLTAFEFGAPPHGGVAPGIDRLVMEGLGTESIRDVIAFPKNQQAQEPMTSAPAPVDDAQLRDLGIALRPPGPG
jgi:aspartyl-tRNA synthetase